MDETKEVKFPRGIFINPKRENSPDFVIGSLSIKVSDFQEWLKGQAVSEKGYITIDILKSREGKSYLKLNEWKPKNN